MQIEPPRVAIPTGSSEAHREPEALSLPAAEFRQFGVSRLAYVTGRYGKDGRVNYVVHAADGVGVAVLDETEMVVDLVMQLGLTLVNVH
jgi:hypothetical protein